MNKVSFDDILKEKDWGEKFNLLIKMKQPKHESIRTRKNIKRKQARAKRLLRVDDRSNSSPRR